MASWEVEDHISQCASALGVVIKDLRPQLLEEDLPHSIDVFQSLLTTEYFERNVHIAKVHILSYIRNLYRLDDEDMVLDSETVHAYLYHYSCFYAESIDTGELVGYIVIGEFDYYPDNRSWPKWKNPAFPDTTEMIREIKLLGCAKGFGRLLFSWGLLKSSYKGSSAIVLEVLGTKHNRAAIEFYRKFGFKQQIAYDDTDGKKRKQVRGNDDLIVYFMGRTSNSEGAFIDFITLKRILSLEFLEQKREGANTAPSPLKRLTPIPVTTSPSPKSPPPPPRLSLHPPSPLHLSSFAPPPIEDTDYSEDSSIDIGSQSDYDYSESSYESDSFIAKSSEDSDSYYTDDEEDSTETDVLSSEEDEEEVQTIAARQKRNPRKAKLK